MVEAPPVWLVGKPVYSTAQVLQLVETAVCSTPWVNWELNKQHKMDEPQDIGQMLSMYTQYIVCIYALYIITEFNPLYKSTIVTSENTTMQINKKWGMDSKNFLVSRDQIYHHNYHEYCQCRGSSGALFNKDSFIQNSGYVHKTNA